MRLYQVFRFFLLFCVCDFARGNELVINLAGDVMIAQNHPLKLREIKENNYFYKNLDSKFKPCDLFIANLEISVIKRKYKPAPKKWIYYLPVEYAHLIKWVNASAFVCANNHVMDMGTKGLLDNMSILDSLNISYCGIGKNQTEARQPVILNSKGHRIGLLSYSKMLGKFMYATAESPGVASGDWDYIKEDLNVLKNKVDIIIVYFHWGREFAIEPRNYQIQLAHYCIDNGAEIVAGSHSHTFMALEKYKNKLIAYGLGNFLFGTFSRRVKSGGFLKVRLKDKKLVRANVVPINVDNFKHFLQPTIAESDEALSILANIRKLSKLRNTDLEIKNYEAILTFN